MSSEVDRIRGLIALARSGDAASKAEFLAWAKANWGTPRMEALMRLEGRLPKYGAGPELLGPDPPAYTPLSAGPFRPYSWGKDVSELEEAGDEVQASLAAGSMSNKGARASAVSGLLKTLPDEIVPDVLQTTMSDLASAYSENADAARKKAFKSDSTLAQGTNQFFEAVGEEFDPLELIMDFNPVGNAVYGGSVSGFSTYDQTGDAARAIGAGAVGAATGYGQGKLLQSGMGKLAKAGSLAGLGFASGVTGAATDAALTEGGDPLEAAKAAVPGALGTAAFMGLLGGVAPKGGPSGVEATPDATPGAEPGGPTSGVHLPPEPAPEPPPAPPKVDIFEEEPPAAEPDQFGSPRTFYAGPDGVSTEPPVAEATPAPPPDPAKENAKRYGAKLGRSLGQQASSAGVPADTAAVDAAVAENIAVAAERGVVIDEASFRAEAQSAALDEFQQATKRMAAEERRKNIETRARANKTKAELDAEQLELKRKKLADEQAAATPAEQPTDDVVAAANSAISGPNLTPEEKKAGKKAIRNIGDPEANKLIHELAAKATAPIAPSGPSVGAPSPDPAMPEGRVAPLPKTPPAPLAPKPPSVTEVETPPGGFPGAGGPVEPPPPGPAAPPPDGEPMPPQADLLASVEVEREAAKRSNPTPTDLEQYAASLRKEADDVAKGGDKGGWYRLARGLLSVAPERKETVVRSKWSAIPADKRQALLAAALETTPDVDLSGLVNLPGEALPGDVIDKILLAVSPLGGVDSTLAGGSADDPSLFTSLKEDIRKEMLAQERLAADAETPVGGEDGFEPGTNRAITERFGDAMSVITPMRSALSGIRKTVNDVLPDESGSEGPEDYLLRVAERVSTIGREAARLFVAAEKGKKAGNKKRQTKEDRIEALRGRDAQRGLDYERYTPQEWESVPNKDSLDRVWDSETGTIVVLGRARVLAEMLGVLTGDVVRPSKSDPTDVDPDWFSTDTELKENTVKDLLERVGAFEFKVLDAMGLVDPGSVITEKNLALALLSDNVQNAALREEIKSEVAKKAKAAKAERAASAGGRVLPIGEADPLSYLQGRATLGGDWAALGGRGSGSPQIEAHVQDQIRGIEKRAADLLERLEANEAGAREAVGGERAELDVSTEDETVLSRAAGAARAGAGAFDAIANVITGLKVGEQLADKVVGRLASGQEVVLGSTVRGYAPEPGSRSMGQPEVSADVRALEKPDITGRSLLQKFYTAVFTVTGTNTALGEFSRPELEAAMFDPDHGSYHRAAPMREVISFVENLRSGTEDGVRKAEATANAWIGAFAARLRDEVQQRSFLTDLEGWKGREKLLDTVTDWVVETEGRPAKPAELLRKSLAMAGEMKDSYALLLGGKKERAIEVWKALRKPDKGGVIEGAPNFTTTDLTMALVWDRVMLLDDMISAIRPVVAAAANDPKGIQSVLMPARGGGDAVSRPRAKGFSLSRESLERVFIASAGGVGSKFSDGPPGLVMKEENFDITSRPSMKSEGRGSPYSSVTIDPKTGEEVSHYAGDEALSVVDQARQAAAEAVLPVHVAFENIKSELAKPSKYASETSTWLRAMASFGAGLREEALSLTNDTNEQSVRAEIDRADGIVNSLRRLADAVDIGYATEHLEKKFIEWTASNKGQDMLGGDTYDTWVKNDRVGATIDRLFTKSRAMRARGATTKIEQFVVDQLVNYGISYPAYAGRIDRFKITSNQKGGISVHPIGMGGHVLSPEEVMAAKAHVAQRVIGGVNIPGAGEVTQFATIPGRGPIPEVQMATLEMQRLIAKQTKRQLDFVDGTKSAEAIGGPLRKENGGICGS